MMMRLLCTHPAGPARRLVAASVAMTCVLALALLAACGGDDGESDVDADTSAEEDASSGGSDASAGADASSDTADASAGDADGDTAACESRTFECGDGTCDALTEYCHLEDGESTCEDLATPEECSPCSTQVSLNNCQGPPGNLDSDDEFPPGCTLDCD
jgi:hypothetical protein